jgi:hypothetical protein
MIAAVTTWAPPPISSLPRHTVTRARAESSGPIFESCYSLHIKPSSSSLEQICFSESHSPSVVALGPGVMTAAGLTF